MAHLVGLLALGAVTVAVGVLASTAGAQRDPVTLQVERVYDQACRCYRYRFAGAVANGAANEYVAVVQQKCGQSFSTAIAGASTRQGGGWEAEASQVQVGVISSGTFRARWNNQLSAPITYRADVPMSLWPLGGGRMRVDVSSIDVPLKLKGRPVDLQRLSAGRWTLLRRARFVAKRGASGSFSVTFTVRRAGLRLRAFVPAKSAGRCFAPTASSAWSSGSAAPAGSSRVIDRTYSCAIAMQGGISELSVSAPEIRVASNWPDGALATASSDLLTLNPNRCSPSSARIPLDSRGLVGRPLRQSHRSFECETPSRVLLRVRAVFSAPAAFEDDRSFGYRALLARGDVTEAAIAVRSQAGRSWALVSLSGSGAVRLFVARGCVEDDN